MVVGYSRENDLQPLAYFHCRDHKLVDPTKSIVFTVQLDENGLLSLQSCTIESDAQPSKPLEQLAPVVQYWLNLSAAKLSEMRVWEEHMHAQDCAAEGVYEFKNKLEAYIYETKQKLTTVYNEYLSPEEHVAIVERFESINQWMYEVDMATAQRELNSKSQEITALLEPMNQRVRHYDEYLKALAEARKETDELSRALEVQDRNTTHVPVRERQRGLSEVDSLRKYFATVESECRTRPKYRQFDPTSTDIGRMLLTLREKVEIIMSKETYGKQEKGNIFSYFTGRKWDKPS